MNSDLVTTGVSLYTPGQTRIVSPGAARAMAAVIVVDAGLGASQLFGSAAPSSSTANVAAACAGSIGPRNVAARLSVTRTGRKRSRCMEPPASAGRAEARDRYNASQPTG